MKQLVDARAAVPANYRRVVESLTDAELRRERVGGKGGPGFQHAVAVEIERRMKRNR